MKVFDHSGHAGVRTIIIINVAGGATYLKVTYN